MKTTLIYFTGTGNSLWVAETLGNLLENTKIVSLVNFKNEDILQSETVGFIFPVYIWGVPGIFLRFIKDLNLKEKYIFAIAVNAGQVAGTLLQLNKHLEKKRCRLNSGFSLKTPSNYIPWGSPCSEADQKKLFSAAEKKLNKIAGTVKTKTDTPPEKDTVLLRSIFTFINRVSAGKVKTMDKKFLADTKCTGCGICKEICPTDNIIMEEKRPVWQGRCEQCFACLQWCPEQAVQFGHKTAEYKRYHNPRVNLKDILKANKKG